MRVARTGGAASVIVMVTTGSVSAQIDPLGVGETISSGAAVLAEAGAVIAMIVFLIVVTLVAAIMGFLFFRDRRENRIAKAKREAEELAARERKDTAEREALQKSQAIYASAAETSDRINSMLMERLEVLTANIQRGTEAQQQHTEGLNTLMTKIDGNTTALNEVKRELEGVKQNVAALAQSVQQARGLTDADRELLRALVETTKKLSQQLEGDEHETTGAIPDVLPDAERDDPTRPRADAAQRAALDADGASGRPRLSDADQLDRGNAGVGAEPDGGSFG